MRFVHSANSVRVGVTWVAMFALLGCEDASTAVKDAGLDARVSSADAHVDAATSSAPSSAASTAPSASEENLVPPVATITDASDATVELDADADATLSDELDASKDSEVAVVSADSGDAAEDATLVEAGPDTGAMCMAATVPLSDSAVADAAVSCFPSCVQELEAACPTTGSCTHDCFGTGAEWDNGVVLSTTFEQESSQTLESTFSLAGGGLCFRVVHQGTPESYAWFDSCGVLIASGTPMAGDAGAGILNVVCEATGVTEQVQLYSEACLRYLGAGGAPETYYGCDSPANCE